MTNYLTALCVILNDNDVSFRVICCFLAIHDFEFFEKLAIAPNLIEVVAVLAKQVVANVVIAETKLHDRALPNRLPYSNPNEMDIATFNTIALNFVEKSPSGLISWMHGHDNHFPRSLVGKYEALCNAHDQLVHYFSEKEIKSASSAAIICSQ
jgi:hypothetical protein